MIDIQHLTKDYGAHRGVFDISLHVAPGEVYGYLGPNGAGKTTTLRHIMGFSRPDAGSITVRGLDAWHDQNEIKRFVGYLPGEIALPEDMKGLDYLHMLAKMRKMPSFQYAEQLIAYFELHADTGIKRMSKGMKQKTAIVSAFMHNPDVIFLDEPTSGLDPLMQERFLRLVTAMKEQGKTIFMSSHIFEEVSKVCDRVGILRQGELINEISMDALRKATRKTYIAEMQSGKGVAELMLAYPQAKWKLLRMTVEIEDSDINRFLRLLADCEVLYLKEEQRSLEDYFMQYYEGGFEQ